MSRPAHIMHHDNRMKPFGRSGRNTPDLEVILRAKVIVSDLIGFVASDTVSFLDEIFAGKKNLAPQELWRIQAEEITFSLHCLDRIAFVILGAENRKIFMDIALGELDEVLGKNFSHNTQASHVRKLVEETYSTRQYKYSKFRISKEGESLKGDLFWEYAKELLNALSDHNPVRISEMSMRASDLFISIEGMMRHHFDPE